MKERPILFNAPMVRAVLDGTKTQTRRVVKPSVRGCTVGTYAGSNGLIEPVNVQEDGDPWTDIVCPYGQPGDRLWVRETWAYSLIDGESPDGNPVSYRADGNEARPPRWRPSIHMPRWASRITLGVNNVRVERLQDISDADALAEGVEPWVKEGGKVWTAHESLGLNTMPRTAYRSLWESINGPGSWDANPWVWVVEFKRVTA